MAKTSAKTVLVYAFFNGVMIGEKPFDKKTALFDLAKTGLIDSPENVTFKTVTAYETALKNDAHKSTKKELKVHTDEIKKAIGLFSKVLDVLHTTKEESRKERNRKVMEIFDVLNIVGESRRERFTNVVAAVESIKGEIVPIQIKMFIASL